MTPMQIYGMVIVSAFWIFCFVAALISIFFIKDEEQRGFAATLSITAGMVAAIGTGLLASSFKG